MATWKDPRTWVANIRVTAAMLNEVRDNIRWLFAKPIGSYVLDEGADFDETTKDTWTAIDTATLQVTVDVPASGRIAIDFVGTFLCITTAGTIHLDVHMAGDSVIADGRLGGDDGMISQYVTTSGVEAIPIFRTVSGLSEGIHTFTLYWKHRSSGTCTARLYGGGTTNVDVHAQFSVEVV